MKSKSACRREALLQAQGLSPEERAAASARITERVLALPLWQKADAVMLYASMATEPDTSALMKEALAGGKLLLLPRCLPNRQLEAVPCRSPEELIPGLYGIGTPVGPAYDGIPSLVIVPCVSATPDGIRLGHGAGYYDRYLSGHPAPTVCLCFHALIRQELPCDAYDIRMDQVVTER